MGMVPQHSLERCPCPTRHALCVATGELCQHYGYPRHRHLVRSRKWGGCGLRRIDRLPRRRQRAADAGLSPLPNPMNRRLPAALRRRGRSRRPGRHVDEGTRTGQPQGSCRQREWNTRGSVPLGMPTSAYWLEKARAGPCESSTGKSGTEMAGGEGRESALIDSGLAGGGMCRRQPVGPVSCGVVR